MRYFKVAHYPQDRRFFRTTRASAEKAYVESARCHRSPERAAFVLAVGVSPRSECRVAGSEPRSGDTLVGEHVFGIVLHACFIQQCKKLIIEGAPPMMLLLARDVFL